MTVFSFDSSQTIFTIKLNNCKNLRLLNNLLSVSNCYFVLLEIPSICMAHQHLNLRLYRKKYCTSFMSFLVSLFCCSFLVSRIFFFFPFVKLLMLCFSKVCFQHLSRKGDKSREEEKQEATHWEPKSLEWRGILWRHSHSMHMDMTFFFTFHFWWFDLIWVEFPVLEICQ